MDELRMVGALVTLPPPFSRQVSPQLLLAEYYCV